MQGGGFLKRHPKEEIIFQKRDIMMISFKNHIFENKNQMTIKM